MAVHSDRTCSYPLLGDDQGSLADSTILQPFRSTYPLHPERHFSILNSRVGGNCYGQISTSASSHLHVSTGPVDSSRISEYKLTSPNLVCAQSALSDYTRIQSIPTRIGYSDSSPSRRISKSTLIDDSYSDILLGQSTVLPGHG